MICIKILEGHQTFLFCPINSGFKLALLETSFLEIYLSLGIKEETIVENNFLLTNYP